MNIINIEHLSKSYSETPLFDDVSFTLNEGEKVGIIGVNGTGKSTLLKIIAGEENGESGKYTRANNVTLSYLPQTPSFDPDQTVLECAVQGNRNHTNEWSLEAEAKTMLAALEFTEFDAKLGTLSGGQRKRAALANVLLSNPDILILDEPTNHLDAFMADWLEDYLKNYKGALVMVTHDRYFLDAVTNRIVEIDHGKIYSYDTNYLGFLKLKAEREDMQAAAERKRQSILRVELEWMMRGAQARRTKQKKQIDQYEEHAAVKAPKKDAELQMASVSTRMGKTTVELLDVSMSYGDKLLFEPFTYRFLQKDRIGFVGPNGCGKTTLMRILTGELRPQAGEVVVGQTIKIGYYAQEIKNDPSMGLQYMDPQMKVIDYIRNTAEYVQTEDGSVTASVMLDRFLFPPEKQYTLIGKLSGGERRRLNLLRVLMEQPNVLILDEPTNDLDIQTMTILEDYLDSFKGIVVTVSHDRYFLDRIVNRIFAFENGVIRQYEGGYTDYLRKRPDPALTTAGKPEAQAVKPEAADKKAYVPTHQEKLKFTYKEQKEYETIDADIEALETKIADLEAQILANATDFGKLNALTKEKDAAEEQLAEKMERWVYLNELAEKIEAQG